MSNGAAYWEDLFWIEQDLKNQGLHKQRNAAEKSS